MAPIRYAKHGEVCIGYQVVGHGPVDVLMVPGFVSNLDLQWTFPEIAAMYRRLGSFSRFITFDKPGSGVSDPIAHVATLEERMEDVHAVLDTVGSKRAALFGFSEGAPMSVLFAATYPERVSALALYGAYATKDGGLGFATPEYAERWRSRAEAIRDHWGEGRVLDLLMPRLTDSVVLRQGIALLERASASPAMARGVLSAALQMDVRDILPAIRVPTVVIHRTDDAFVPVEAGRWMAGQIPGARFVELPGDIHHPWFGDMDAVIDEVEELVTRVRRSHEPDRALATVLFTDIVDSTRRAAQLGDRAWRELLERHDALARGQVDRFRGRYIKSTGDGMLARAALTTGTRTGAAIVKRSTSRGTPTTLTLGSSVWRHQLDELICHDRLMGDDSERCERCGTPLRVVILNGRQLRYEYSTYFDAGLVRMAEKVKMLHTAQRCEFAELLSTANPAPWQRKLDA